MNDKPRYINVSGKLMDLYSPKVMGIINVTPDSFYSGSRCNSETEIIEKAALMIREGADFLDVGGYSSRPGAENIPVEEERKRVSLAVKAIKREFPESIISIDTFRADLARESVLEWGAAIINDISGGEGDPDMFRTIADLNVPYIMMHMKGTPENMQHNPVYDDVVSDVIRWFGTRIAVLQQQGLKDLIIDPGFGFGKTINHNFELLKRLNEFSVCNLPVMVGISRKSMIWRTLEIAAGDALNGTTFLHAFALNNGANILRVHDVKAASEAVKLFNKFHN